jgi:hypothetical protein
MDLTDTIAPNSDQLDAVDLLTGPRTFTIERVSKGNAEQPVNLHLTEFDRPWRPGKSMRRVLVACWGADSSAYIGRRVTLWCDPSVQFGGAAVGGTRITHMSHLDKARVIPLLVTRGKSAPYKVLPLPDAAPSTPEVSLALRIDEAVSAFGKGGITRDQLQVRLGKLSEDWTAQDLASLLVLFDQLKRREITKEAAFPSPDDAATGDGEPILTEEEIEAVNEHWEGQ